MQPTQRQRLYNDTAVLHGCIGLVGLICITQKTLHFLSLPHHYCINLFMNVICISFNSHLNVAPFAWTFFVWIPWHQPVIASLPPPPPMHPYFLCCPGPAGSTPAGDWHGFRLMQMLKRASKRYASTFPFSVTDALSMQHPGMTNWLKIPPVCLSE